MAAKPNDLAKLEADFLSGRNPLAYIPLCNALRRQRQYSQALDTCQLGLSRDPNSIAGRTLFARLLADMGRYSDALQEVQKVEPMAPDAMGLMVEKARCLIKMRRTQEAAETLRMLDQRNPMDPQVQLLNSQLRSLQGEDYRQSREVSTADVSVNLPLEDIVSSLMQQLKTLGVIKMVAALDLDSGKSCVEGELDITGAAEMNYQEVALACDELDQGTVRYQVLEMVKAQVLIVRRGRRMIVAAADPEVNFGKLHHRVFSASLRMITESAAAGARPIAQD
ncbi:tetratricopeptide repeat protein [bacterium]|nr:tetratricopeptide repeat protein [bacterium]